MLNDDPLEAKLLNVPQSSSKLGDAMDTLIILISSSLFITLFFILVNFFYKNWWTPIQLQEQMGRQGIKGPPYKFIYGNVKEIFNMKKEATSRPMDISHKIFPRIQPNIYTWISMYGNNFIYWHGPRAQLVVTETGMVKDILNDKDEVFPKLEPPEFYKKLLGDGLVVTNGEKWAKLRKLANHAFHGENLKGMIPLMIESTEMMLERWKQYEGKEIEIFEEFRLFTAEVISRTAFGSSYIEGKNLFEMMSKLVLISSRNMYKIRFPGISKLYKTGDEIDAEKLEKGILDSILEMKRNREKKVMTGEVDSFGSDYLGLLVKANHDTDESKRITVDELVDECKIFYLAGQETTNTLLAWTVFLLAVHPEWQDEARKEVLTLFGKQTPNSDGIARLKSMNMIINESLRLYPPATIMQRRVKGKIKQGKLVFPDNLSLLISILAIHHDPNIWGEDVHLFKPERFAEGVAKATTYNNNNNNNNNMAAYLPFGMGPRTCVGMNFASAEVKIALSMILQRYSFSLSPSYAHSPHQLVTIRPQHGIQVKLHAVQCKRL